MSAIVKEDRLRGPNLSGFILGALGLPFEEGLAKADMANRVIASNQKLSSELVGNNCLAYVQDAFACWSGTMAAYVEPERELGEAVVYLDPQTGFRWIFPVPEAHRMEKDAILAVDHPDFFLEIEGKNRFIHARNVEVIRSFPARDGWYKGDWAHDIPCGYPAGNLHRRSRYLCRIERRVGPVARGFDGYAGDWRLTDLMDRPSLALGMVVESPEKGMLLYENGPLVVKRDSEVVVRGTPEQLDAAVMLLKHLNLKK